MRKILSIKDMKKLAKQNGGECLSTEYVNVDSKLKWRCQCSYEWETIPYLILNGSWCPTCAKENRVKK